ncbi:MAG: CoA ester lyase [Clostridiaceae bacterium]|jgi:2-keto-3-deoxy-L-rhamnonate aldolase RhmA|nr:CoA ester lyase [Clostridiaceae bacterium]
MPLKLMYITNSPMVATIAEQSGVDRIWIDLEHMGKEERQRGMNSVKSNHKLADVAMLRPYVKNSELMVRVNPLHENSRVEIDEVITSGADLVMLPMFRTVDDAFRFVDIVGGRAKVMLLVETAEAIENLDEIVKVSGIDEIHIGLNDLHLAYGLNFMFELVADGTIDKACEIIRSADIPFGFGGVAKLGEGLLPAEYVLAEHYRLGSSMVILSRTFCNTWLSKEEVELKNVFSTGVKKLRDYETMLVQQDDLYFIKMHKKVQEIVYSISKEIKNKRG